MANIPPRDRALEGILWYIRHKGLATGDRLPSERDLSEFLGVSRTALRASIALLVSNGLLECRRGSGTYILPPKPIGLLQSSYSYSDAVTAAGLLPSSRVISARMIQADGGLSSRMELDIGSPLFQMQRVRLANEDPVSIETTYIDCSLCPGVEAHDYEHESLYAVLRDEYDIWVEHGDERISITRLNDDEAVLLGAEAGSPAFYQNMRGICSGGHPIECTKSVILPDRFQFAISSFIAPVNVEVDDEWLKSRWF